MTPSDSQLEEASRLMKAGMAHYQRGQYAPAAECFHQALEIRRRVLGEEHPQTLASLNNLAYCLQALGRAGEALPHYERALKIGRRVLGEEHPQTLISFNNLAGCLWGMQEDLNRALDLFLEGLKREAQMFQRLRTLPEQMRRSYLRQYSLTLPVAITLVLSLPEVDSDRLSRLFAEAAHRHRIENELQAAPQDAVLLERYPHLAEPIRERQALEMQIGHLYLTDPLGKMETIRGLERQAEEIERTLLPHIEELRAEMATLDRGALALSLPPGSTLVEYLRYHRYDIASREWGEERYAAFTLEQGEAGQLRLIDLGEAAPIDELIQTFRQLAGGRGGPKASKVEKVASASEANARQRAETIRQVADRIWRPLGAVVQGRRVVVVPDGEVAMVPFDLFPEAGSITYRAASADLLTRTTTDSSAQNSAPLILGDPNYRLTATRVAPDVGPSTYIRPPAGKRPPTPRRRRNLDIALVDESEVAISRLFRDERAGITRLPGSHLEAQRVGSLLGSRPHVWNEALLPLLRQHPAPSLLFLATHGFAMADLALAGLPVDDPRSEQGRARAKEMKAYVDSQLDPLQRCGIALAGAHSFWESGRPHPEAGDGFLTGYKITLLDLRGSDVILSACNPNVTVRRNGRGMLGLRTALFHAGARSLILTLWPISDFATGPFMEELCRLRYKENRSPLEALNASKEYLRTLTIGEMKAGYWLSEEAEQALLELRQSSMGYPDDEKVFDTTLEEMQRLRSLPDAHCPFADPVYWAAFVLYGGW